MTISYRATPPIIRQGKKTKYMCPSFTDTFNEVILFIAETNSQDDKESISDSESILGKGLLLLGPSIDKDGSSLRIPSAKRKPKNCLIVVNRRAAVEADNPRLSWLAK